jgi:hypothetical protein
MTRAGGSNSFSPDDRPGFASGAVPLRHRFLGVATSPFYTRELGTVHKTERLSAILSSVAPQTPFCDDPHLCGVGFVNRVLRGQGCNGGDLPIGAILYAKRTVEV